jgi:hypothetical protein
MTTLLPAAMLAEEVEQTLANNTEPDRRWQVTAARDILEHGCLGDGTFSVTSHGYSHNQSGRPDPGLVFRRLTLLVLLTR